MKLLAFLLALSAFAQTPFALKSGDRVVFYGDSITDQRLYTTFAETFIVTRFPSLPVSFVHSGWGGDRVSGGGGGPIDVRLARDVYAYKPNVVTIMLGMNDGRYRAFDQEISDTYTKGFERMVADIKRALPGVRITAIRPSPYDEVTRPAMPGGGYNPVLIRYGDFLKELAAREGLGVADLNWDLVKTLEKANATDPANAQKILPDRVHPGPAGHLIMAGSLLKAWNAPSVVSSVEIDASSKRVTAKNTQVSGVAGALVWTQSDAALPMPIDMSDPVMELAVRSSDFVETLNQQPLKVTSLTQGHYALRIDGQQVGVFSSAQLGAGLNLAMLPTPMLKQALDVHALTLKHNNVHNVRWRTLQVPLDPDKPERMSAALAAIDSLEEELVAKQRAAAQPKSHRYELIKVPDVMSSIPLGFTPIFNGVDRAGWHISETNHHGKTQAWNVVNGVLTGTQDKPGHGGILLTDKTYRNFEIYLELNPDYGCDGGLFLRSTEKGEAYQVLLDYRDQGEVGGVYGERLPGVKTYVPPTWRDNWKKGEWNTIRARIEGSTPRIQVWMNGVKITEWTDTVNHAIGGAVEGMIAVQVHGGSKIWKEGGAHRFRNIAVRELP